MRLAKILQPIRSRSLAGAEEETRSPTLLGVVPAPADRVTRVGTNPVTNTSPPGPLAHAEAARPSSKEEEWLALLELVFDQTGWPDA